MLWSIKEKTRQMETQEDSFRALQQQPAQPVNPPLVQMGPHEKSIMALQQKQI